MNNIHFELLLNKRLERIKQILSQKGREYASTTDRLYNFKKAAAYMRCTPIQTCLAFMTKHLLSIADLVETQAAGTTPNADLVDEKIGDAINYLILLEALFAEK